MPGINFVLVVCLVVCGLVAASVVTRQFERAVNLEQTSETSANASTGDLDGDGDLDIVLAQITIHTCEEGWSAIAEWTGVPLSLVLDAAGMLPAARFVSFHSWDDWADRIDMLDALHPQTILAYGMNGQDLPVPHGAPVRLRVERQMGYKSMKYLRRIVVREEFDDGGRNGGIQNEWSWYAGI